MKAELIPVSLAWYKWEYFLYPLGGIQVTWLPRISLSIFHRFWVKHPGGERLREISCRTEQREGMVRFQDLDCTCKVFWHRDELFLCFNMLGLVELTEKQLWKDFFTPDAHHLNWTLISFEINNSFEEVEKDDFFFVRLYFFYFLEKTGTQAKRDLIKTQPRLSKTLFIFQFFFSSRRIFLIAEQEWSKCSLL